MPTAKLEFSLPDEEWEHRVAMFGGDAVAALSWLGNHFRRTAKHDALNAEAAAWALEAYAEAVRDLPFEEL